MHLGHVLLQKSEGLLEHAPECNIVVEKWFMGRAEHLTSLLVVE